jgi:hypothetical protein
LSNNGLVLTHGEPLGLSPNACQIMVDLLRMAPNTGVILTMCNMELIFISNEHTFRERTTSFVDLIHVTNACLLI